MDVEYENKKLIDSGTFLTFGLGVSKLKLTHNEDTVYLYFNVINDEDNEASNTIEYELISDEIMEIQLINYHQIMGSYSFGPENIGDVGGEDIFLLFRVTGSKNRNVKEITYSIYAGEK